MDLRSSGCYPLSPPFPPYLSNIACPHPALPSATISPLPCADLRYLVGELPPDKRHAAAAYTWEEGGFYRTLKEKVHKRFLAEGGGWGPTLGMHALSLAILVLWVSAFAQVVRTGSWKYAVLAGFLLHVIFGVGHNFFHQRDSPWRYVFDLGIFPHRLWRVSHAISHHLYPVRASSRRCRPERV